MLFRGSTGMQDLRELRRMAGWTQTKVSHASGINRTRLSQAECGEIVLTSAEDGELRSVLLNAARHHAVQIEHALAKTCSDGGVMV